ncbi:hypothetical protein ACPJHQ_01855 [Rossellomorea sp. H39__3]
MVVYKIGKNSNKKRVLHKNRLDKMHKLSLKSFSVQHDLETNFGFNSNDIRSTTFGRICNILDTRRVSYLMISEFQQKKLSQKKYRNKVFDSSLPIYGDLNFVYQNSIADLKRGYFLDIFQTFESTIRQLNVQLGNKNIPGLFKIFNENILTSTGLSTHRKVRAKELLVFISLLRNSIHNNGIYVPIHGSYKHSFPLNYKGDSYSYKKNDKIIINFELLLVITEDVIEVLKYIIKDDNFNSKIVGSGTFRTAFIKDMTL